MRKQILGAIFAVLLALITHPILANSETVLTDDAIITAGGNIREGQGEDALKITFAVDIFINFYVDENGEPVDKYGQLVFSEPPAGNLHIIFHNTGNDDVDKGKFTTTDINLVSIRPQSFQDPDGEDNYTFARIEANGKFNGENGWSILVRFADFGSPGNSKAHSDNLTDAVRINLFDYTSSPEGFPDAAVYDTAFDYPREQGRSTLFDGGNITVYY